MASISSSAISGPHTSRTLRVVFGKLRVLFLGASTPRLLFYRLFINDKPVVAAHPVGEEERAAVLFA